MKRTEKLALLVLALLLILENFRPAAVYAADAAVTFGSESYEKKLRETFPVGIYVNTENGAGEYLVTIRYNPLRLAYVSGADEADEENGILTLSGQNARAKLKYWLTFTTLSGGDTYLAVESAVIHLPGDPPGLYDVVSLPVASVAIEGADTAAEEEMRLALADGDREGDEAPGDTGDAEGDDSENSQGTNGADEAGTAQGSAEARESQAGETEETEQEKKAPPVIFNVYVAALLGSVILIVLAELTVFGIRRLIRTLKAKKTEKAPLTDGAGTWGTGAELPDLGREVKAMLMEDALGIPLIRIEDVTMEFRLSSGEPSGLKDYLIQMMKRQITYRKLYALYHVSFNVYRGEVVGIIGSNGSGKSTLLKIVSGVLKPTSGRVQVDRRKVQLLTLGTGFDMELTARENVYLNGSIIGYSRAFLNEHYDDIVRFAELEDFMEEKVKSFSSGMVSRLGFAIATAGDAAEILILDEVLSVGDEFFRKKSLKRIREMIHGGSTVLMVSHGMETILENCSKCVWIEKGKLRMMGEPKAVCEAYRRMEEKKV